MQAALAPSWEMEHTGKSRWALALFPSLTDMAFLLPFFLLLVMLSGPTALFSDGDTGWHIRTGEWILQHHAVPLIDLFSFTKPHDAWYAWEWGWDVLFALVHQNVGLQGVALVNIVLLGIISALEFRLIRRVTDNDLLSFAFTVLAVCCSMIHWLARPHLFSWLFMLIFLHLLLSAERGNRTVLYWLPGLMLLWVNLHGAFFIGVFLVFAQGCGEAIRGFLEDNQSLQNAFNRSRPYFLCAAACAAVTFINPYTWHLHQHVAAYLHDSKLLNSIQEFQSTDFHQPHAFFFELMLLSGAAAILWCVQRKKFSGALILGAWTHLALLAGRNVPVFAWIAAPWIALMCQDLFSDAVSLSWFRRAGEAMLSVSREFKPFERVPRWHLVSALAVLFVAVALEAKQPGFDVQFSPKNFPVHALSALRAANGSRLFTYDQWGDYLIYELYPEKRVFMDGRSDFYGDDFLTPYKNILNARYDWETILKRFAIDTIMVRPDAPIGTVLKASPNWKLLFDDGSVLLFRQNSMHSKFDDEVRGFRSPDGGRKFGVLLNPKQMSEIQTSRKGETHD